MGFAGDICEALRIGLASVRANAVPAIDPAGALAAKRGRTPCELPYAELKRQLVANGVFI